MRTRKLKNETNNKKSRRQVRGDDHQIEVVQKTERTFKWLNNKSDVTLARSTAETHVTSATPECDGIEEREVITKERKGRKKRGIQTVFLIDNVSVAEPKHD